MQTISILETIINTIYQNPAILPNLPWEDIESCVLTEFELRSHLYPTEQYDAVTSDIRQTISQLRLGAQFIGSQGAIDSMKKLQAMLSALPELSFSDDRNMRATFLEAYYRHRQNHTVVVLGDSHANFFSQNEALTYEPVGNDINLCPQRGELPLTVFHLGPCLAYRSPDDASTFQWKKKTEYLISHFIRPHARLLICLGEIDIRMHVWKQARQTERTYQEVVDDILKKYRAFLTWLKEQDFAVSVWAPIASQSDNAPIDPSFPRTGSETERNTATLYFHDKLEKLCREQGFGFYAITKMLISEDNRTNEAYLSADHCHLSQRAMELALPVIKPLLD